jgi:hypothetical protein
MFRAMFLPIFRSSLTAYTALVQCTDLLLTRDTVEMELSSSRSRPAANQGHR